MTNEFDLLWLVMSTKVPTIAGSPDNATFKLPSTPTCRQRGSMEPLAHP
jgi:hypothetical protein